MKLITTSTPEGVSVAFDWTVGESNRRCGGCTLCCKLLSNVSLEKPAGKVCRYQRSGKGCAIYSRRPFECESWSCRWLIAADETAGMKRPDRAHYCIDPMLDEIRVAPDAGEPVTLACLQVWIDPAFMSAKDDPELRAYLAMMAERHGLPAVLRFDNRRAIVLFPPALNQDGKWHEASSNLSVSEEFGNFSRLPESVREHYARQDTGGSS